MWVSRASSTAWWTPRVRVCITNLLTLPAKLFCNHCLIVTAPGKQVANVLFPCRGLCLFSFGASGYSLKNTSALWWVQQYWRTCRKSDSFFSHEWWISDILLALYIPESSLWFFIFVLIKKVQLHTRAHVIHTHMLHIRLIAAPGWWVYSQLVCVSWMPSLEQTGVVLISMGYPENMSFPCLFYMQSKNVMEVSLTCRMSHISSFYHPTHEAFSCFKNWICIIYLALFLLQ